MPFKLMFYAHCGMTQELGKFDAIEDAYQEFASICDDRISAGHLVEDVTALRKQHREVVRAAEILEPEDAAMISDDVGVLEVQIIWFKCYGCDSEFETQGAADDCCDRSIE